MMVTHIVGATLEQGNLYRHLERLAHQRNIAIEQLILQCFCASGNDDLTAHEQSRNQISKSLAGAGARLGDQDLLIFHRVGNRDGHVDLLGAWLKVF